MLLRLLSWLWSFACTLRTILLGPRRTQPKFEGLGDVDYRRGDMRMAELTPKATGLRYCVIGTGFLGQTLVRTLLARGETNITAMDIAVPKDLAAHPFVTFVKGNMMNKDDLKKVLSSGIDVVYLTAATIRFSERLPHQLAASYNVNVVGTRNVIEACVEYSVPMLVQTSTSNVSIGLREARLNMDERNPYSSPPFINHYTRTKIEAEKAVLLANGTPLRGGGVLTTGSIRPCSGIFGHMDPFIVGPALRDGSVNLIAADQVIDNVYVENIVLGHLLLEYALRTKPDQVAGQPFCISNDAPVSQYEFYWLLKHFYPTLEIGTMAPVLGVLLAAFSEAVQFLFRGRVSLGRLDYLTLATINLTIINYTFSSDKARRLLGYAPAYTVAEGLQKSVAEYLKEVKRV